MFIRTGSADHLAGSSGQKIQLSNNFFVALAHCSTVPVSDKSYFVLSLHICIISLISFSVICSTLSPSLSCIKKVMHAFSFSLSKPCLRLLRVLSSVTTLLCLFIALWIPALASLNSSFIHLSVILYLHLFISLFPRPSNLSCSGFTNFPSSIFSCFRLYVFPFQFSFSRTSAFWTKLQFPVLPLLSPTIHSSFNLLFLHLSISPSSPTTVHPALFFFTEQILRFMALL